MVVRPRRKFRLMFDTRPSLFSSLGRGVDAAWSMHGMCTSKRGEGTAD